MGGQQFLHGGTVLDTSAMRGVAEFDRVRGQVVVLAGTRWPELLNWLHQDPRNLAPWTIRQKQTGADDFSIGGSVAANIHGRGLDFAPLIEDLVWIEVICADGILVRASRSERADLFALVVGGYGLFGVVVRACLQLVRARTLQRDVRLLRTDEAIRGFNAALTCGAVYGDFQFAIDPASTDYFELGIQSCYTPVQGEPDPELVSLDEDGFRELLLLAHVDKTRAFERYARFYLSTHGQRYPANAQHGGVYPAHYHDAVDHHLGHAGSEMITELYVPRECLADFLADAGALLRSHRAEPIYGTVRLIRRDHESFLAWARESWACVVLNLHVSHDPPGLKRACHAFRGLIDLAIHRSGSYYLTYHHWARADQVEAAYPNFREFLRAKREYDPHGLFQSNWYRHMAQFFVRSP